MLPPVAAPIHTFVPSDLWLLYVPLASAAQDASADAKAIAIVFVPE